MPYNGDFIQRHAEAVATTLQVTAIHVISDKDAKKTEIEDTVINNVRTLIAYPTFSKNPLLKFFRFFKAYLYLLKQVGHFDIVHLNRIYPAGFIALYLKWFQSKRYIISEHWHGYHKPFCKKISFGERFFSKQIAKNASSICPVSDHLAKAMQDFGLTNRSYITVPNVIDTALFKPIEKEQEVYTVIHVSSMDSVKNVPKILNVISELSQAKINFKFHLIGNNATDFKELAKELKIPSLQINFVNQLPQEDLVPYIQQADVLLLFSVIENLPCVILEAFSCGVSVVSTNVGGIHEYFPENFGTLIPVDNSKALLEALAYYQTSSKEVSKQEMHNYIDQNFSKKRIAEAFTKVYLSLLIK